MVPGASKLKFYNLTDTRLFVLTVNCYSDIQKDAQIIDNEFIFRTFLHLTRQYSVKFPAQFNIDNEEKILCFEKTTIFAAGHLKQPAILATLTECGIIIMWEE